MPKKRYNAEAFIHKLRKAEVLITQDKTVIKTCNNSASQVRYWPKITPHLLNSCQTTIDPDQTLANW